MTMFNSYVKLSEGGMTSKSWLLLFDVLCDFNIKRKGETNSARAPNCISQDGLEHRYTPNPRGWVVGFKGDMSSPESRWIEVGIYF